MTIMSEPGTTFIINGKLMIAEKYDKDMEMWICREFNTSNHSYILDEEVYFNKIKYKKGKDVKTMYLEYKFYEKNLAPKWLEGDYDLHIEGNRMTMTSKDGKKVEARCHPDDDWRLQVGIDELKERMAEAKKPREIKVGDNVKFKHNAVDWYYPHTVSDWCRTNQISVDDVMTAYTSDIIFNEREDELEDYKFRVVTMDKYKNRTLAYIMDVNNHYAFIVNTEWLELVE